MSVIRFDVFQSDDPVVLVAAIQALHKVFSHLIKTQEMYMPKPVDPDNLPEGKHAMSSCHLELCFVLCIQWTLCIG